MNARLALDLWMFPAGTSLPDEKRFLATAAALAASGEFREGSMRAWEMPGTEIFFALFFKLFPGKAAALMAIRMAQGILVALQSILIGSLAMRLFRDKTAALIATLIAAFYPFYLFYQGMALSETCRKQLENAETRVEMLIRKEGKVQPEPFRPEK